MEWYLNAALAQPTSLAVGPKNDEDTMNKCTGQLAN